jgi:DNA-binding GntR family transcriptional regulator
LRKHQQVAAQIRQKIADGAEGYEPGAKLPTIRELAAEYGVSPAIFDLAVVELKAEGLITGVQGGRLRVAVREPNGPPTPVDAA